MRKSYFIKSDDIVRTLSDVLLPQTRRVTQLPASVWDIFSPADFPYLGVVAGCIGLAAFDGLESTRAAVLRARMGAISGFHDIAILDTPSSLALLTRACLCASTHVIVPVSPAGQGEEGLRLVAECMGSMKCGDATPDLRVVCNRFDCRDRSSGLLYERLKVEWGERVFDTIIHCDDTIEACSEHDRPVMASAPGSLAVDLYARLADEVLAKLHLTPIGQATTVEGW